MPGVLTKKQCWRRQAITNNRRFADFEKRNNVPRSFSEGSIVQSSSSTLGSRKQWSTMSDLQNSCRHDLFGNKRKSVMFSARVNVVLIPCITEYENAGLASLMWWTDDDYKLFKQYALEEVKEFMLRFKIMDSKEAIRRLYQYQDDPAPSSSSVSITVLPSPDSESGNGGSANSEPKLPEINDSHLPSSEYKGNDICQNSVLPESSQSCFMQSIRCMPPAGDANSFPLYLKSPAMCKYPSHQDDGKSATEKNFNVPITNRSYEEQIHPLALICS